MAASSPALFLDVLGVVRRWRRPILLTSAAAAVVSAVVALRMPNIYPATTTFYATNLETADPDQLAAGERRVVLLPEPGDLDRAVNIGRSQPVSEYIIRKYRLAAHWHYDTSSTPEALQMVRDEFNDRLDIQVTDRDAVELTFLDEDRNLAAEVANAIVARIDTISQQLMQPNRQRVLSLFENKYRTLDFSYQITRDTLQRLRLQSGLLGLEREDRYLAKALVEKETALREARARLAAQQASGQGVGTLAAEIKGLEAALDGLKRRQPGSNTLTLDSYHHSRYRISRLQAELDALQNSLVQARAAYETARATLSGRVSTVYVVQPAYPVARKVKPIRWLIVVASTLGAFALTTLAAMLLETLRGQAGLEPWEEEPVPATPASWPKEKVRS